MEKVVLKVEGMSCEHCVKAVEHALGELDGIESVAVDLGAGTASVSYDPALVDTQHMKLQIEDQGYDVIL